MTVDKFLNDSQLEELREFDTPTICNTIESFKVRKNTEGFMNPSIKCIIPYEKPIVGYAITAKISSKKPPTDNEKKLSEIYYKMISESTVPTIAVIEDMDAEPIGSFWGGVNDSIHAALGCNGVITNGGVRDLEDAKKLGFRYFAKEILVSHAYCHLAEVNCDVNVGGLVLKFGDLLHADMHGVIIIPHEISAKLSKACREVIAAEEIVIKACRSAISGKKKIEVENLLKLLKEMKIKRDCLRI